MNYLLNNVELFLFLLLSISCVFLLIFKFDRKFDSVVFVFITLVYLLFVFVRPNLGVDESVYLNEYIQYINTGITPFHFSMEFIFSLFGYIGINENNFTLIFTFLYPCITFFVINIVVQDKFKAITQFLFLFSDFSLDFNFNLYRQGLATLFFILSAHYFFNRNWFLFIVFSIVSLGFHWSASIVIVLLLVSKFINDNTCKKFLICGLILQLLVFFIKINTLEFVYQIGESIFSGSIYLTKIRNYILFSDNTFSSLNFQYRVMFMFPVYCSYALCIYLSFNKEKDVNYIHKQLISLMSLIGIYALVLIDMNFSFRNYYWLCSLAPLLVGFVPNRNVRVHTMIKGYAIFWAFAGFYSGPLMKLIF